MTIVFEFQSVFLQTKSKSPDNSPGQLVVIKFYNVMEFEQDVVDPSSHSSKV